MRLVQHVQAICYFFIFTISLNADGPVKIKGLSLDMGFEEACKVMKHYPLEETMSFCMDREAGQCGIKLNVWKECNPMSYIRTDDLKTIKTIRLYATYVDTLFGVKQLSGSEFAQAFIDGYSWINTLNSKTRYSNLYKAMVTDYSYISREYNWKIEINFRKDIIIHNLGRKISFSENAPSFEEEATKATNVKIKIPPLSPIKLSEDQCGDIEAYWLEPIEQHTYKKCIGALKEEISDFKKQYTQCQETSYKVSKEFYITVMKRLQTRLNQSKQEWEKEWKNRMIHAPGVSRDSHIGWGPNGNMPGPDFRP